MPFKMDTNIAILTPGMSKNKWKSKMFTEIGANKINTNATHFLNKSMMPIKTSKMPTIGKI